MNSGARGVVQLLSPYGQWSHRKGMQLVDEEAARRIRDSFMRGFDRIWGLPIYVGHPDDGRHPHKARAVGRVESVSATPEGIAISARYSEEAYKKLSGGELRWLSPRWQMQRLEDGRYRPVRLISVGMTNNPNIPGSGSILSPGRSARGEAMQKCARGAKEAVQRCSAIAPKIARCARTAEAISKEAERVRRERIDSGLAKMSRKPSPAELARLASERAEKTGESYVKSFALLRRKYYGARRPANFGTNERPAK